MGWLSVVETDKDAVSRIILWFMCLESQRFFSRNEDEKTTKSIWKRDLPGFVDLRKLFEFAGGRCISCRKWGYTHLLYWKYKVYTIHRGYLAGRFRSIVLVFKQKIPQLESSCPLLCRLYLAERSQVTQQAGSEDDGGGWTKKTSGFLQQHLKHL